MCPRLIRAFRSLDAIVGGNQCLFRRRGFEDAKPLFCQLRSDQGARRAVVASQQHNALPGRIVRHVLRLGRGRRRMIRQEDAEC